MPRGLNFVLNERIARIVSAAGCGSFLLIHVALLVLFSYFGVWPMAYFNVFSVLFYSSMFLLIRKNLLREFCILTYFEVVAHMVTASILVGWECAFQITLIGISALAFFAEYVGRCIDVKHMPALPLCVFGAVMYIVTFVVDGAITTPYPLPGEVAYALQIAWAIITFGISLFCLQGFVFITFRTETVLSERMSHDNLTGLPNRYFMAEYLSRLEASGEMPHHWLAIMDIDDFKVINDTHGHLCGDAVLRSLANTLSACESAQVTCRWGGEEFLLLGRMTEDVSEVVEGLDCLRETVANQVFVYDKLRLRVTITIGLAGFEDGGSLADWLNRADQKLYEGKASGKNKVVW